MLVYWWCQDFSTIWNWIMLIEVKWTSFKLWKYPLTCENIIHRMMTWSITHLQSLKQNNLRSIKFISVHMPSSISIMSFCDPIFIMISMLHLFLNCFTLELFMNFKLGRIIHYTFNNSCNIIYICQISWHCNWIPNVETKGSEEKS